MVSEHTSADFGALCVEHDGHMFVRALLHSLLDVVVVSVLQVGIESVEVGSPCQILCLGSDLKPFGLLPALKILEAEEKIEDIENSSRLPLTISFSSFDTSKEQVVQDHSSVVLVLLHR